MRCPGCSPAISLTQPVLDGRVMSVIDSTKFPLMMSGLVDVFFRKTKKASGGCIEWCAGRDADGYGRLHFGKSSLRCHRLSYYLFCGDISDGIKVMHKCDNPPCVNPVHLSIGTHEDNVKDMITKGRRKNRSDMDKGGVYTMWMLSGMSKSEYSRLVCVDYGVSSRTILRCLDRVLADVGNAE